MGEIQYRESGVPMYRFSRLEGATAVDTSDFCDAPTPAFVQISSRNPGQKRPNEQEERPNGKLYMAIQYSEPQQFMREEFTRNPPTVPPDAKELFEQWLSQPVASPPAVLQSLVQPPASPVIRNGPPSSVPQSRFNIKQQPISLPPITNALGSSNNRTHGGSNRMMLMLSENQMEMDSTTTDDLVTPMNRMTRKRTSDNVNANVNVNFDRMSVGAVSTSVVSDAKNNKKLNTIKELIQNVHEHLPEATMKETDLVSPGFRVPMMDDPSDLTVQEIVKVLRADSMDFLQTDIEEEEEDMFRRLDRKLSANMSAEELFSALKRPNSEMLTRSEMKRAIQTLLQMPIPSNLLEQTFRSCDKEGTGKVTLENFVRAIRERERELWIEFQSIDTDGSGEITLDELKAARFKGHFNAQERELNALLDAMDRLSLGTNMSHASDRKIQWSEFRAMMVLLPPATTIQTIVHLVKDKLDEQDQLQGVQLELDEYEPYVAQFSYQQLDAHHHQPQAYSSHAYSSSSSAHAPVHHSATTTSTTYPTEASFAGFGLLDQVFFSRSSSQSSTPHDMGGQNGGTQTTEHSSAFSSASGSAFIPGRGKLSRSAAIALGQLNSNPAPAPSTVSSSINTSATSAPVRNSGGFAHAFNFGAASVVGPSVMAPPPPVPKQNSRPSPDPFTNPADFFLSLYDSNFEDHIWSSSDNIN